MQKSKLVIRLSLCGLALSSLLIMHENNNIVHADALTNPDAITWDSDSDSQAAKQNNTQENVNNKNVNSNVTQNAEQGKPSQNSVSANQAPQKSNAETSTVQSFSLSRPLTNHVANVQSTPVQNTNRTQNQVKQNIKVANLDSDSQMPVETQKVAVFDQHAKMYMIKINQQYDKWVKSSPNYNIPQNGMDGEWWGTDNNVTDSGGTNPAQDANHVILNGESGTGVSWTTQFLTDTGATYNGKRVGILIKPTITKETTAEFRGTSDGYEYGWQGLQPSMFGYLPYASSQSSTSNYDVLRDQQLNYSYVAVPVDMDTGDVITGLSLVGTSVNGGKVPEWDVNKEYVNGVNKYKYTPNTDTNHGTVITKGTLVAKQDEVLPVVRQAILDIKAGKIKYPTIYHEALPGQSESDFNLSVQNNYEWVNRFGSESDGSTPEFDWYHNTLLPAEENIAYLAVQTRKVDPQDSRAHKTAQRVISVNLPNDQAVRDRYRGILNSNNQIVQTINFTRTGVENLGDGSIQWGNWTGPSGFPEVTLPDVPGYTMEMS